MWLCWVSASLSSDRPSTSLKNGVSVWICGVIAVLTSIAGSGVASFADGIGTNASFNSPYSVAVDLQGNLLVADTANQRIRHVSPAGGAF